ncbi:hypothetical protein LYSHEL_30990 [Lysobacter helvus]|uniref:ABC transporter permease n=2 Tax=Lysobacteraceae TaxID=32033 RepID=A0ABM7Q9N7_9GAMM|nr:MULTISPECIES: hypothetical protein [Lysobacter]BCT94072.1 hypothetical protein LYSCAS_30960 [Lysobacter caseinilyticus]BCT97228.1 hypothetical protein LYSHEL_30990 [Lysobacter helvus]
MLAFLLGLVVVACVTVVPVMVGARLVHATHTGFWRCVLAVLLLVVVGAGVSMFVHDKIASGLVTALIGAFFLAGILGTTYLRGLAISIIAAVVQIVVLVLLAGALLGGAALLH